MRRIVIVGVGALGSHVALFARNWPEPLVLVDHDRTETKNTQAQFHSTMGVGRNKAQALQQALSGLWKIKVTAVPHKLTTDNVKQLLGEAALVVDCTDNAEARRVIRGFVRTNDIPCLHGAMSADGTLGRIVWTEHFTPDEEGAPGQATCEDGENLPFHGLVGAQIAVVAQRFLKTGEHRSFQMVPTGIVRIA